MDLALLRTFLTVHRAGSLTRGAAQLGVSQPAVTGQIRTLERQLQRPLFVRQARGVAPTAAGEELARKIAPHLDALTEIAGTELDEEAAHGTVHLAGPPEFITLRVLPALAPLVEQRLTVRVAFADSAASLEAVSSGHSDLALTTARPRGRLLTTTPLCDEELVLVAAERWATRLGGPAAVRAHGSRALEQVPAVSVHETMPLMTRYWATVFNLPLTRSGSVIAPDLRAVLECVAVGVGIAVLPRYLCGTALDTGRLVALLDPPEPPLRTYFLTVRTDVATRPRVARTRERLLRAAADW